METLLTIRAVASILDCSPRHVRRIIAAGELPVVATGESEKGDRVDPADLRNYIQRRKRNRSAPTCPSTNVMVFGTRASKSVDDELNVLLGQGGKRKRKSSKPPSVNA